MFSGNQGKKIDVCCQLQENPNLLLQPNQDFLHKVKFQESFKRWKKKILGRFERGYFYFKSNAWEAV